VASMTSVGALAQQRRRSGTGASVGAGAQQRRRSGTRFVPPLSFAGDVVRKQRILPCDGRRTAEEQLNANPRASRYM